MQRVTILLGCHRHIASRGNIGIGALGDCGDLILGVEMIGVQAKRRCDVFSFGRGSPLGDLPVNDGLEVLW